MASSTFTNAYLVDFESVLNIPDNEGMQNMFKALESSGLRGFLGCKSVLYEPELEHFFDTALIQGGDITWVISGKYFSISPSRFAGVFELPTEGLSDFSDVPKNLVSDARKIFSKSGVPVVPHGKKKLLKYEYRLLNDILAKSITVKAGSFDAVTTERFQMMTAIHFGLMVNWSKILFGVLEEMVDRTVKKAKGSYVTTNQTADTHGQSDEGGKTPVAIVKRASKSKKKSESTSDAPVEIVLEVAGSKKRPETEGNPCARDLVVEIIALKVKIKQKFFGLEPPRAGRAWLAFAGRWPRAHFCAVVELRRAAVRLVWRGDAQRRARPAAARWAIGGSLPCANRCAMVLLDAPLSGATCWKVPRLARRRAAMRRTQCWWRPPPCGRRPANLRRRCDG
ncbi:hypothetical protein F511_25168 [Dorcoceras hygrometricum]|uniref:Dystroglycan-like n=1 Tax=Dorcoceras hygrometricum TaxID=472368 RepID=A0A2Z7BAV7_9LAMI|nr:hypothetical protein F511_25168 [Dorcoceras hygrometricum]